MRDSERPSAAPLSSLPEDLGNSDCVRALVQMLSAWRAADETASGNDAPRGYHAQLSEPDRLRIHPAPPAERPRNAENFEFLRHARHRAGGLGTSAPRRG